MQSEYVPAIVCPFCRGEHEVAIARNGRPYASCGEYMNRIFGNSPASLALFQNGGQVRAKYSNPRIRNNPGPKKDSMDAFLADENEEEKAVCATCGAEVQEGVIRCPNGHELDWPEETKENPQEE